MAESVYFKPLSIAFAIVTLIESVIWSILSFLAILCYNDIIEHNTNANYGLNVFGNNLYKLYFSGETFTNGRAVTQDVFYTLMWIYFLLSLFLSFISGVHIAVLMQKSSIRKINLSTIIWQILTYTICIYDIITCILFGVDYNLMLKDKTDTAESEVMLAVIITLIVLSAKGFVLWIVNLVFSVVITVLFRKKVIVNDEPILSAGPVVHAKNYSAYDAYGNNNNDDRDMEDNNNNRTNNRPEEEISPQQYPAMNDSTWFTKLDDGTSRRNITSASERPISPSNSTWSHIPRASSFRQPRSLAASLSPSPVPPPSRETPRSGRKSAPPDVWNNDGGYEVYSNGYRTDDEGTRDDDDDFDDDDDISESMNKMSQVFPITGRFNVDEDDDVSESMSKMVRVFPNHRRFNLDEPDPDYEKQIVNIVTET